MKQLSWMAVALVLFMLCVVISYQVFIDAAYILYSINLFLLGLVLFLGSARLGAQRWFLIGGFAFQPSEFIKISFILTLSSYIGVRKGSMGSLRNLFWPLLLAAMPAVLVLLQPDLGTASLLVPILLAVLFIGGANIRHLTGLILIGLASLPAFWNLMHGYQRQRLVVFLNPNVDPLGAGYTVIQSKIAIGSGGLFGKGWLAGTQNQLNFLPERHTDFIFSVLGEEWGLMGTACIVLLYLLIIMKAFRIAYLTTDIYGKLVATGIAVMLALQTVINIGMTMGLMPVVGIPLPLVSYGGSSLVSTSLALGLLVNVGMRRSRF
jgi:rod shape determining protein RodA